MLRLSMAMSIVASVTPIITAGESDADQLNREQRHAIEAGETAPDPFLRLVEIHRGARPERMGRYQAGYLESRGWYFYGLVVTVDGDALNVDSAAVEIRYPRVRTGDLVPMFGRIYHVWPWSQDGIHQGIAGIWKPDSVLPKDILIAIDSIPLLQMGPPLPGREDLIPGPPTYRGGLIHVRATLPAAWGAWYGNVDRLYSSIFELRSIKKDDAGALMAEIRSNDGGRRPLVDDWITIYVREGDTIDAGPFKHTVRKIVPSDANRIQEHPPKEGDRFVIGWVELSIESSMPPEDPMPAAEPDSEESGEQHPPESESRSTAPTPAEDRAGKGTTVPMSSSPEAGSLSRRWLVMLLIGLGGAVGIVVLLRSGLRRNR